MKGDFSRLTGLKAKRKHYNGVLKQQGRVQLDSDWNELISIISHQRKTRTTDTIGHCGAPIHNSGYQILHPGNVLHDLLIATGRFYAGGLLCETTPSSKLSINTISAAGIMAVDDLKIDGVNLELDQWVQIKTDEHPQGIIGQLTEVDDINGQLKMNPNISSLSGDLHPFLRRLILYSNQTDFPLPTNYNPEDGQTDLLYLDAWERHITTVEDAELREVALGGPDTDTRSKIIAQVKVLPNVGDVQCKDEINDWHDLIKPPDGRLTTRLVAPADPANPCQLGESGGFLGLENHLYRVEIHDIDATDQVSFKWSRDNAAHAYPIKEFIDTGGVIFTKIRLQQDGKDDILKIKQQDWIEVSGDETDLNTEQAGTLVQVLKVEGDILTLDTNVVAHKDEAYPKIRRWEISNQRPDVTTPIVSGNGFQLEDGIEIEFSGTKYKVGDYWVFSARTLTGEIEILDKEPPLGINHHYCKLALVTVIDGGVDIEDCRPEFPPLTELPSASGKGGCCTVTVGEHGDFQDIQLAIDSLNGGHGTVCIKPGVYIINKPIQIKGRDITIKGCEGTATIINVSKERDAGIIFHIQNSWDIKIHDLWCLSLTGARVIEVENSLFFSLYDCMLIGGGVSDLGGIITCQGLTINTRIYDNIILGMIGIRYDGVVEQSLNLHINVRIEKNIMFVLENSLFQDYDAGILGIDMIDNLMLGISLDLISKAFFPEALFKVVEKEKNHDPEGIKEAKIARKKGVRFESIANGNTSPANSLSKHLKLESSEVKIKKGKLVAGAFPTGKPVVNLSGALIDANFTDNILIGKAGVLVHMALESKIDNNMIIVQQQGVEVGLFEGLAIKDNYVMAGTTAIKCNGLIAMNLSLENNRIACQANGVEFIESKEQNFQLALNIQIRNNWISAKQIGISMNNPGIFLQDFTAIDNTINESEVAGIVINVLDENQFLEKDIANFQRVIQRNSISVKGVGIALNASDSKIIDNEININNNPNQEFKNRGIMLLATNGTIANNNIHGIVNIKEKMYSYGGIFLNAGKEYDSTKYHEIDIHNNKIIGGRGNGIEIVSNISGLVIEENQIAGMGLNGVAVKQDVRFVNNLRIKGNHINDCLQLAGDKEFLWWQYAGIVLSNTHKTQIIGNLICDNGISKKKDGPAISAFYAERISEINISDNHFINNGNPKTASTQAVIHIPIEDNNINRINSDIQISNNLIKSLQSPALILGNYSNIIEDGEEVVAATDKKAVITSNHFESNNRGPIVELHISHCVFSSNYVSCLPKISVSLGYGWFVMANGNVISDPITGAGYEQHQVNNLEF